MKFIKAEISYLERMCEITEQAKIQLKKIGTDQWQYGYPSEDVWKNDIKEGCTYLAVSEDGQIVGIFAFQQEPDKSYEVIEGKWLTDEPYASVHRVCVADEAKGRGVAGAIFKYAFSMAEKAGFRSIRIDTHPGNIPMQRALKKAGFEECGYIHLKGGCEDGHLRIAFECTSDKW